MLNDYIFIIGTCGGRSEQETCQFHIWAVLESQRWVIYLTIRVASSIQLFFFYFAILSNYFITHVLQLDAGEWIIQGNKKLFGGHIDVPEISFGELDDLQVPLIIHFNTFQTLNFEMAYLND